MYIDISVVKGIEYATLTSSERKGNKVIKTRQDYLGRVIDKERGIYQNRERGLYTYDLDTNTYGRVPADFVQPGISRKTKYPRRPILDVSFGDVYVLYEFIKKSGFDKAINAIEYPNPDTIYALLFYYLLSDLANCHAAEWWELSFVKYLYPNAQLLSQRISETLADLGSEDAKRKFFTEYDKFLEHNSKKKDGNVDKTEERPLLDDGILIDSTGLPNAVHIPITAVSNHNGDIENEIRLIYVVQQSTGMPLFFRYIGGNVIDATTITRTIGELKASGINTKFSILDAGYYTGINADALYDAGVSFVARMKSNFKVYKNVVSQYLSELESRENAVIYNNRLVYIKCVECMIGKKEDKKAYAYLCKDMNMNHLLQEHVLAKARDQGMKAEKVHDEIQEQGIFVLVSSRRIAKDKLLPLYYTRDKIEKIFELCKKNGKILPLNIETTATLRGHLLMTFMATVLSKMMSDKLKKKKLTIDYTLATLHEQRALVYDEEFIITEPQRNMNDAYKALGLKSPDVIKRKTNVD